jgi:very-short-patch-repair endonuclease
MSPPEARLWQILRTRPCGLKFRRQHPIDPYVVDFYCREARLIIEIDGLTHEGGGAGRDEIRDERLSEMGFAILRIPAAEVRRDANAVVEEILARAVPPRPGEDK